MNDLDKYIKERKIDKLVDQKLKEKGVMNNKKKDSNTSGYTVVDFINIEIKYFSNQKALFDYLKSDGVDTKEEVEGVLEDIKIFKGKMVEVNVDITTSVNISIKEK